MVLATQFLALDRTSLKVQIGISPCINIMCDSLYLTTYYDAKMHK